MFIYILDYRLPAPPVFRSVARDPLRWRDLFPVYTFDLVGRMDYVIPGRDTQGIKWPRRVNESELNSTDKQLGQATGPAPKEKVRTP